MNIHRLFDDGSFVEKELDFFLKKKHIKKIPENSPLVISFLEKAKHNMAFYKENKEKSSYNDWLIVILYYALYHCALALITKKQYASKNHYATILILVKEYNISSAEAQLIDELSINKTDAELYTNLKDDRHDASYSTSIRFSDKKVLDYESQVIDFINKTDQLLMD